MISNTPPRGQEPITCRKHSERGWKRKKVVLIYEGFPSGDQEPLNGTRTHGVRWKILRKITQKPACTFKACWFHHADTDS